MEKCQLKGKYIPDKDGKLRHTLNFTKMNVSLPVPVNYRYNLFFPTRSVSWYKKIWLWLTNNIL